jgi:hypothetical protein
MPSDFRVAFWNVQNLYAPGVKPNGPQSEAELEAKLDAVAGVLNGLFNEGVDLIGLAEVHSEAMLLRLKRRLTHNYDHLFEPCHDGNWPGLSVLARVSHVPSLIKLKDFRPYSNAMPRWLAVQCELPDRREPMVFVVNHWRSRIVGANGDRDRPEIDRIEAASELRQWLLGLERESCVVVMGDFNAEPFERPFGEWGLCGVRHFVRELWATPAPSCLYNTAWRFLSEPDNWETFDAAGGGYAAPRPRTTIKADKAAPSAVFDQLLVSGRALRGGPISLRETTVGYASAGASGMRMPDGYMVPSSWNYACLNRRGASDHFPLIATFRLN